MIKFIKKVIKDMWDVLYMRCECGGTYTDGGAYNHFSCNNCGKHL